MLPTRRQLHSLTRDPAMMRRAVLLTAAVFLATAIWIGFTRPASPPIPRPGEAALPGIASALNSLNPDRTALLRALRDDAEAQARRGMSRDPEEEYAQEPISPRQLPLLLAAGSLPVEEQNAFLAWHQAVGAGTVPPGLIAQLAGFPMPSAPGLPRTMAADLQRVARDYQGALAAYEAVGSDPANIEARRRAVSLSMNRGWTEVTARLLAQPAYYQAVHSVSDTLSHLVAREQLDVRLLFRRSLDNMISGFQHVDYLLLSLLTASVWFISLHLACRLPRRQWWLSLAGLPLGIFSTVIAIFLQSLQEARHGLADSDAAGPALLFQIASVGLREELSKLLCFLPLCLLLLRRGTPAQAFMAASCAGLGFALQENIGYYLQYGGEAVLARFVSSTFLHLALTGLTGLALFKFLRYPRNFAPPFFATFTGMVLFHGFYNFSQGGFDNPFARELAHLFPWLIAGLAWHYFRSIREEQDDAPQLLGAEFVFLLGTTIVMGTLLNYLVQQSGWDEALKAFVPTALSSVVTCWLFHHFLRHA